MSRISDEEKQARQYLAQWQRAHGDGPKLKDAAKFSARGSSGSGFAYSASGLKSLAAQMGTDETELGSQTTSFGAAPTGQGAAGSDWTTAIRFGANAGNVHAGVHGLMTQLHTYYQQVVGNVQLTAKNYNDADSASTTAINSVDS
jgi:hypothetical protein